MPVEVLANPENEKDKRATVGGDATQATKSGVKAAGDGPGKVEVPRAAPESQFPVVPLAWCRDAWVRHETNRAG